MPNKTFVLCFALLTGCEELLADGDTGDTGRGPSGDDGVGGGGGNGGGGNGGDDDTTPSTPDTWSIVSGPCAGYRTETLAFADDGSVFAGCGADVGGSFAAEPGMWQTLPVLSSFHLYDAQIGDDGQLYVAGDDTASLAIAYRGDASDGAAFSPELLHIYDGTIDGIPLAGGIVRTPSGVVHIDGQNGNAYAVSKNDGDSFASLYFYNYQRMDVDLGNDGKLYASGATISQPPTIFFPTADESSWTTLSLPGYIGELFGIEAIDADHLVAVGVDEPSHHGLLVRCLDGNCTQSSGWTQDDLTASPLVGAPADAGRLWAVHFDPSGTFGIAVGEKYPQSLGGYAIYTTDGGRTWDQAENPGFPMLTECWSFGDGRFAVAGGGGFMAISIPLP